MRGFVLYRDHMTPVGERAADALDLLLNFGSILRQERHWRGATLMDVSRATGVDKATISRVELGQLPAKKVAVALLHWLAEG